MREDTENWGHYNRKIALSLRCIILISSSCYIRAQKWIIFAVIMTHSQLLSHGEELRNDEGACKRLKTSVAHFDNSALIKTYSKTLIGRCMNPKEQEMKALFTNFLKIWKLEEKGYWY